jgi:hypothetical protein
MPERQLVKLLDARTGTVVTLNVAGDPVLILRYGCDPALISDREMTAALELRRLYQHATKRLSYASIKTDERMVQTTSGPRARPATQATALGNTVDVRNSDVLFDLMGAIDRDDRKLVGDIAVHCAKHPRTRQELQRLKHGLACVADRLVQRHVTHRTRKACNRPRR